MQPTHPPTTITSLAQTDALRFSSGPRPAPGMQHGSHQLNSSSLTLPVLPAHQALGERVFSNSTNSAQFTIPILKTEKTRLSRGNNLVEVTGKGGTELHFESKSDSLQARAWGPAASPRRPANPCQSSPGFFHLGNEARWRCTQCKEGLVKAGVHGLRALGTHTWMARLTWCHKWHVHSLLTPPTPPSSIPGQIKGPLLCPSS